MTVLFKSDRGVFISHQLYVENIFRKVSFDSNSISMRLKKELFDINTPFLRKNETIKVLTRSFEPKKKRKRNLSGYSVKLSQMALMVKGKLAEIIEEGKKEGVFEEALMSSCSVIEDGERGESVMVPDITSFYSIEDGRKEEDSRNEDDLCLSQPERNCRARAAAEEFYRDSWKRRIIPLHGTNSSLSAVMMNVSDEDDSYYLFPQRCSFHCCDVKDIDLHVKGLFDLVVLDPPWWNKFIRRKNAKCVEAGYQMMNNEDLASVPVGKMLNPGALVAVWCTNSESNMETLEKKIFPQWGLDFIGRWFWVKVTKSGEPVCQFYPPPGRQPFEQIIFGKRKVNENTADLKIEWEDERVIVSVPSALHSHKPPLTEVLKPYLKPEPNCLELFARYLLPGWTSVGFEVLKLQHQSLYEKVNDNFC